MWLSVAMILTIIFKKREFCIVIYLLNTKYYFSYIFRQSHQYSVTFYFIIFQLFFYKCEC